MLRGARWRSLGARWIRWRALALRGWASAYEATIVSKWERGLQISRLDTAQDLADALGATVEQLLSDARDTLPDGVADVAPRRPLETVTAKMLARLSDRELEAAHALVLRLAEREPPQR